MTDPSELAARAIGRDPEAEAELLVRAGGGCIEVQRALLVAALLDGEHPVCLILLARMVAARGGAEDRRRLAGVLWLLAADERAVGHREASEVSEAEALAILNELADAGDGPALDALAAFARGDRRPEMLLAAGEGKIDVHLVEPPEPPPLVATGLAAALPPLTRWERVKDWIGWRWMLVRWWIADRLYGLAAAIG